MKKYRWNKKLFNWRKKSIWIDKKKNEKVYTTPNYIEHFIIVGSAITGFVSFSAFASLVGLPIGVTSSVIGFKICAITAAIKKSWVNN